MTVKAKCRNCGREASADQFKLHYKYKMMVCPDCFTGRTQKPEEQQKKPVEAPARPPGWDKDDEYLEKMVRLKRQESQAQFTKIAGTDYVQCKCNSCSFTFRYNPVRRMPLACPYCNVTVPKFKPF